MVVRALPVIVVGMLGGCDLVLGLDSFDPPATLCGPYGAPTPVAFDPALGGATDFSVAADGSHGMVYATYNGLPGPTPIVFDPASQTWKPDTRPGRQMALATNLSGGHMGVTGDVYGWIDHSKGLGVASIERATFVDTTASWMFSAPIQSSSLFDILTGNEVESDAGSGTKTSYVVEIQRSFDGTGLDTITILAAGPPSFVFTATSFAQPLDLVPGLGPTGGALTGDHGILVYSAIRPDVTGSHFYETSFAHNQFTEGHLLSSLYADGHSDDQPWVNADCSRIWFRRDGVTYTAQSM